MHKKFKIQNNHMSLLEKGKIIQEEWAKLSDHQKNEYKLIADRMNQEKAAALGTQ